MYVSSSYRSFLLPAFASASEVTSKLRWELTSTTVGVVILSFGLAGLALFLFRRKTGDGSLLFFSLFSFLFAIRLIFRQSLFQSLALASANSWKYCHLVIGLLHR